MEQQATNLPKWLSDLENRKQKPRLAHETGAGAACMNCNSACPGLDLHFWRKICKNCKCGRDDHDVGDDEFPQFDLLFGPSGKFKKKPIHLKVNNKKQSDETFEWVPPDISKELAMDYMKALPAEKLPIKGSSGAALRRQLLQKQLPLHDIDYKVCDKLSEHEQKDFEKYLERIKKYVGQGKVMKILGPQPFDCSFINATNKQPCSSQYKPHIPPSTGVHLCLPSSFIAQNSCTEHKPQNKQEATIIDNKISTMEGSNYLDNMSVNSNIVKSQPIEGRFYDLNKQRVPREAVHCSKYASGTCVPCETTTHSERCKEVLNNNALDLVHSEAINREAASIAESMLADALLPPSAIRANDIVGSTLDEKELMYIREKLTDKYSAMENPVIHALPKSSRSLDTREVSNIHSAKEYNSASTKDAEKLVARNPERNLSSTEKAEIGSQYSVNALLQAELNSSVLQPTIIHSVQLQNQIFPHIVEGNESVQNMQHIECLKDLENLTINSTKSQKCEKCHENICDGEVAVIVEKANNASWHPKCFVCSVCNELLADLVYFYYKNKLYCGRDLAEFLGIPRCFACDELIFVREYTVAEGHNYHVKHFCCWDCDIPLAGQQYIIEDDHPLCLPCYQTSYAKTCDTCHEAIAADDQGVSIKNLNFHARCFRCYVCKINLLSSRMMVKENKLFCSVPCLGMINQIINVPIVPRRT